MFRFRELDSLQGIRHIEYSSVPLTLFQLGGVVANLSGTTTGAITETSLVAGGRISIITLAGGTLPLAGAAFDAERASYIAGFSASITSITGWNNEVRDKTPVTACTRLSDASYQILWPAQPGLDVTTIEIVTPTVHAAGVIGSDDPIIASPSFSILPVTLSEGGFDFVRAPVRKPVRSILRSKIRN